MSSAVSFPEDDNLEYVYIGWSELGEIATTLAENILKNHHSPIDRIVALATGGHTMSKALKDYLDVGKISSMQISFYTGIGKRGETPIITQSLSTNIEGENILIFDDVNDTGATIETAKKYLEMRGASSISTATLLSKPHTSFPSDYYGRELDSWIVFPDEVRETITLLSEKWSEKGISKDDITSRLKEIGFSDRHLEIVKL